MIDKKCSTDYNVSHEIVNIEVVACRVLLEEEVTHVPVVGEYRDDEGSEPCGVVTYTLNLESQIEDGQDK